MSKRAVVFENFRLSGRGSIRRPPNCLTWVASLGKLHGTGDRDFTTIIKGWNGVCSSNMALTGRKALAVRNLMEKMSRPTLELLTNLVSEYGWEDMPFTEDTLSSKRIWPGHTFRVDGSKVWTARQCVSAKSLHLMVERAVWEHKQHGPGPRTEKEMAERAMQAAVVVALAQEARATTPVTEEEVEEHLLSRWRTGDFQVDVELRSVMALHEEKFTVRDLHFLKDMFEKSHHHHPTGAMAHTAEQIQVQVGELEGATFQLTMRQVQYDADAFGVFLQKMSSFHRATYSKKLEWDQQQHRASLEAAKAFLERNTRITDVSQGQLVDTYRAFRATIKKLHNLADEDLVRGPVSLLKQGTHNQPGSPTMGT